MKNRIARAFIITVALATLAGCSGGLEDIAPKKATRELPHKIVAAMNSKGMKKTSPIMMRIFKEESILEVWKQKNNGKYDLIASYDICKWSGELGPKYMEGDRQAPVPVPWRMVWLLCFWFAAILAAAVAVEYLGGSGLF